MDILKSAVAGSLESSDVQVTIEPGQDGISVDISSSVLRQYGRQIKKVVLETLERLDVRSAKLTPDWIWFAIFSYSPVSVAWRILMCPI